MSDRPELIAGYIPVIQSGYIDLFDRHPRALIGVFDNDILQSFDYLKKDIRALKPETSVAAIEGLGRTARYLGLTAMSNILTETDTPVFMPDDDVSHGLIDKLSITEKRVTFESVFLRWNRQNTKVNKDIEPDLTVDAHDLNPQIIDLLQAEQNMSANSWRHVGAVIVKDDMILDSSHNHSLPTAYTTIIDGDPRNTARRGESIETSNDIHAESGLIASLAKKGISSDKTDMYVTTFPCPNCAKLMAMSGIERCYYTEGYAMLDGEEVLRSAGVKLIKINGFESKDTQDSTRAYPPS